MPGYAGTPPGTGICFQSTIFPFRISNSAAAFVPGASQWCRGRSPSRNVAVTRSPDTRRSTILPAQGRAALNPTARARDSRRTSSDPWTMRALWANNAAAAALSFAFSALLHARTTCAGEGAAASKAAATTNARTARQYPFWGTHRKTPPCRKSGHEDPARRRRAGTAGAPPRHVRERGGDGRRGSVGVRGARPHSRGAAGPDRPRPEDAGDQRHRPVRVAEVVGAHARDSDRPADGG